MPSFSTSTLVLTFAIILVLASPAYAFGAGNIASVAKIEGVNCKHPPSSRPFVGWAYLTFSGRHGDIEDTLLTLVMSRAAGGKKFDKMNVARVYFGNWLRDYCKWLDSRCFRYFDGPGNTTGD